MKSARHLGRSCWAALALIIGTIGLVPTPSATAAPGSLAGGGEFHSLVPERIFDSRPASPVNDVAPLGAKPLSPAVATFDIQLLGVGGIPEQAANVLAVAVNITVTEAGNGGYLKAYGKGAPVSASSIVNFVRGSTVPNMALVRPGADGKLTVGLFGQSGTAHVVVDVFGWFSTSAVAAGGDGARLIPTTPSRILDTRDGTNRSPAGPVGPTSWIELPIRGVDGVNPAVVDVVPNSTDVVGVLLNVVGITTSAASRSTYVSVVPEQTQASPRTSNLNLPVNAVKANLVIVPVGADGKVRLFNFAGSTHLVADVVGYLAANQNVDTRRGRVVPLTSPYRTFDTREPQWGGVALGTNQTEDWSFAEFAASVSIGPDAVGEQLGVIGNLTNASLTRQSASVPVSSFLTMWPANLSRPGSSNLNTGEGVVVPNLAVLTYGTNYTVKAYNLSGYAHYLFDASAVILADPAA
jgi:hypothetical protein